MEKKINKLMTPQFDPNEGMVEGGPMGPELEKLQPKFDWISKNCFDIRPSGHVWLPQMLIEAE